MDIIDRFDNIEVKEIEKADDTKDIKSLSFEDKLHYIYNNLDFCKYLIYRKMGISDGNVMELDKQLGEKGFCDRCSLLNRYYGLYRLVNTYFDRVVESNFEAEKLHEKDIEFIKSYVITHKLIDEILYTTYKISQYNNRHTIKSCEINEHFVNFNNDGDKGDWRLRIGYIEDKVFKTVGTFSLLDTLFGDMRGFCSANLYPDNLINMYLDDIELDFLSPEALEMYNIALDTVSMRLLSVVDKKHLNRAHLISAKDSELIYRTTYRKSIESLDSMVSDLRMIGNVDIDLYRDVKVDKGGRVTYRHSIISGDKFRADNVTAKTQTDLIKYYKGLLGKKIVSADLICEVNGELVKSLNKKPLEFTEEFSTFYNAV